ncbi:MAG: glycosyltransferase family 4 protein [Syntrophobacterales bacterium]|nr:glycosyltransferase family 4 protein [Syntrophobacterales bacterium]
MDKISKSPYNILYFSSFGHLRWGGQKSLFHLVTHLDRQRHTPHVLVPTDEGLAQALRRRGIDVIIRPLPPLDWRHPGPILETFRFLNHLIKERNICLLHTDGPRNTFYGSLAARWRRIPTVWHIRSSEKDPLDLLLTPLCERVILVAQSLRARFLYVNNEKFVTIYNGVDIWEFDAASPRPTRKDLGLNQTTILIGSFARLDPMKGQLGLIEACGMLSNEFDFRLFLCGDINDPLYHRCCLAAAERFGISENVIFSGFQEDVIPLLKAMDIVVLNSHEEAFPRSVIEAMAAARPVIATDVGGTKEAVEEGITGFILPPGDRVALEDRLKKLARDPSLRTVLGRAGRKRVEALFSVESNVHKTEQLYRKILEATPHQ